MLKSPFPYFGGKSRVALEVWERFGAVKNYVEPFAGSAAMLLARPRSSVVSPAHDQDWGIETINDADGLISNFWRAMRALESIGKFQTVMTRSSERRPSDII